MQVDEPDVEFGAPAPTTDLTLQKALEYLTQKKAAYGSNDPNTTRTDHRTPDVYWRFGLKPEFATDRRVAQLVRAPP